MPSNVKVSAMPALTGATLAVGDQLYVAHSSQSKSITVTELVKGLPVDSTLSGASGTLTVSALVGDVTGVPGTTVVATVGGSTAANIHTSQLATAAATSANTASTIVKRDASGNFTAGTVTVTQLVSASATPCSFAGVAAVVTSTIAAADVKAAFNALCTALGITTA